MLVNFLKFPNKQKKLYPWCRTACNHSVVAVTQAWKVADAPKNDKFQYTYFAHKINSFDTAPQKLLASDSRLRPDRYALEQGDLTKAGLEKSRSLSLKLDFVFYIYLCALIII